RKIRFWGNPQPNKPWMDLHMELVAAGVKDPPLASRGYALTSVAVYDAVLATWHWKYRYRRDPPSGSPSVPGAGSVPSYPSEHAAIAGAASLVLAYLFPGQPAARFEELAEEAALSRVWAGANFPSDVAAGLELGRAVARKVIARAETDGSDRRWDGTRPSGIGGGPWFWDHPPGTVTPPVQPLAGSWKTWLMISGGQFRPDPPYPYGSREFLAESREVMQVGAGLTARQEGIAKFWAGGLGTPLPPGLWNQIAQHYAARAGLDAPRAARLFALLNVALADAGVAVWDAKYTWWSPRPVNAIRDLGLDPDWRPYLPTPSFPSYVSGHSGYSAAAAEVLAHIFPSQAKVLRAKAEEAAISRLYGGIHFRSDNEAGRRLGRRIGQLAVERSRRDGA
ncbi:MAG: phosphatase PAP2 family protein, partial [Actinomycetota bacterium]